MGTYDPNQIDDAIFIISHPDYTDENNPYGWFQEDFDQAEATVMREYVSTGLGIR